MPEDHGQSVLVGRIWSPEYAGPTTVLVQRDGLYDLSRVAATSSQLFNLSDPVTAIREAGTLLRLGSLAEVLANSAYDVRDSRLPWFLAPCDLQAIKASGVTFVASLLERVIEEQARGDPSKAEAVRRSIVSIIGDNVSGIKPGSREALRLKDVMIAEGVWSQYLEVGIGADAEIFTKSQPTLVAGRVNSCISPKSQNCFGQSNLRFRVSDLRCRNCPISKFFFAPVASSNHGAVV